jgi:hypothetical protein
VGFDSFSFPDGLWMWCIPIPGGFDADKTGLQGIVCSALVSFVLEVLVTVSGLTSGHVAGWASLSHWNKVRRVLHQATVSMSLELIDTLIALDPTSRSSLAPGHLNDTSDAAAADSLMFI